MLRSVFLLDSNSAGWRFREDPAIGKRFRKGFLNTPKAALPSMSVGCRPGGSLDQYDHRHVCAESESLLRLIRPHHPPWMKAVYHSSAALERVGLMNSTSLLFPTLNTTLWKDIQQLKGLTVVG